MSPTNQFLTHFTLNFAAQLGASLALGALGRVEQALQTDPEVTALQHAYATGIVAMLTTFPIQTGDERAHYESLLQTYFEDETIKAELFKLVQPNQTPDRAVLLAHLKAIIHITNVPDFKPEEAIKALLQGFEAGAYDSEEFRSRLTLKQLIHIGHHSGQQTQLLEKLTAEVRCLSQQMMAATFVPLSGPRNQRQSGFGPPFTSAPSPPISPHLCHLAEKIHQGRVALFVGAGVSREAGLPSGWELAEMLAARIDYIPQPGDTLGTIAEYYDQTLPGSLIEVLIKWLDEGKRPGPSHQLIPQFNWQAIYTTNYDQLLERGYQNAAKDYQKVLYNRQLRDLSTETIPIIKLHGCLSYEHRYSSQAPIVITDKNYEEYGLDRDALIGKLRQFLNEGNLLLFLGYSLKDSFWQDIRRDVASVLQEYMPAYYAVIPHFTPQWAEYWRSRHVRLIAGTAHTFLQQLVQMVDRQP